MTQRGRKSADAIAAQAALSVVVPQHLKCPADLDRDEKKVWQQTVEAFSAGWFTPEDVPMLRAYVAACVLHDRLRAQASGAPLLLPGRAGSAVPNPIFAMMKNAAHTIASLSGKLRISKASRTAPSAKAGRTGPATLGEAANAAPWDKTA